MRALSFRPFMAAIPIFYTFTPTQAQNVGLKTPVYKGCYTDAGDLSNIGSYTFQTPGYCQQQCANQNKAVFATNNGSNCYCGDLLPDPGEKASDSTCNVKCNGYGQDTCGGSSSWSVSLTGIDDSVGSSSSSSSDSNSDSDSNTDSDSDSTSSSDSAPATSQASTPSPTTAKNAKPSVVTHASTIVVTAPGQTRAQTTVITTTDAPAKSGPNVAGIAVGVVVAVVVLSAVTGGVFFFLQNRKKRAIEDEYRRNVANAYGAKPPTSSAGSVSDSRLEPSVMMQRRQSDGSIADNHDYSRRILKVTNPDGS